MKSVVDKRPDEISYQNAARCPTKKLSPFTTVSVRLGGLPGPSNESTGMKQPAPRWREVYPQLSEGSPGLVAAITNRVEAQVAHLSLMYAPLDVSRMVCQKLQRQPVPYGTTVKTARGPFSDIPSAIRQSMISWWNYAGVPRHDTDGDSELPCSEPPRERNRPGSKGHRRSRACNQAQVFGNGRRPTNRCDRGEEIKGSSFRSFTL